MKRMALATVVLVALLCATAGAQESDLKTVQQEIQALRKEMQGMQRQLQEITRLLQARPAQPGPAAAAAPADPPLPTELSTAGAAVKGARTAPLTIVEFRLPVPVLRPPFP
jgi:hypothetical protein